jgi:DMSO/TMAO reductase YedYZ molybdopterin-dependent catalytic subunit
MAEEEMEGEWVMGWPDRKRARIMPSKDVEGRVIFARSPVLDLEGMLTPTDAYYIVAQLDMPDPVHPDDFSFSVGGMVDDPVEYTLDELRKLPGGRTVRAVTECTGNDGEHFDYLREGSNTKKPSMRTVHDENISLNRSGPENEIGFEDVVRGVPSTCLVSGGEWTGVRLKSVLERAGVQEGAVCVALHGRDEGKPDPMFQYVSVGRNDFEVVDPGIINYAKGLPIDKAMHEDTILAWAHNGEYLTHVHGAPLRLVVPGWCGNWWVKWIDKIEVLDHTPEFYYQTHYFVAGQSPEDPNKTAMTAIGVKTLITSPREENGPIKHGTHAIRGRTWSGEGAVVRVEISIDGGETWNDAEIEESGDRWLWRRFSYFWDVPEPGTYKVMARGTDEAGRVQPCIDWNFQRKHFDGIVPEIITVT